MLAVVIVICLVIVCVFLLFVPLDVKITWDTRQTPSGHIRLEWLFGLFGKDIRKVRVRSEKKKEESRPVPGLTEKFPIMRDVTEIISTKGLLKQTLRLIHSICRQFRIGYLSADIKVGLGDSADTGILFGYISSMMPFLRHTGTQLSVYPVFYGDAVCEFDMQGELRLQPVRLVIPLVKYTLSPASIKVIGALIIRECKRRKYMRNSRQKSMA